METTINRKPGPVISQKDEIQLTILYAGKTEEVIEQIEAAHGVTLLKAESLLAAISCFNKGIVPDAVLCELDVYDGDSFELNRLMRNRNELRKVPFILLCWEFREDVVKTALHEKVDDIFTFPLPPIKSLIGRIEYLKEFHSKNHEPSKQGTNGILFEIPLSKRLFDLFFSIFTLILVTPLLLVVILAIRLESKGKVYYTSKRIGRKTFNLYKLRSMRSGAEEELSKLAKNRNKYLKEEIVTEIDYSAPCPRCPKPAESRDCTPMLHISEVKICEYWYHIQKSRVIQSKPSFIKIDHDPRITKVGRFIRNTCIDELPQLINVIKGDMSLVGNRPIPVYEAEKLTNDLYSKRFLAPAGLTGLWQIQSRNRSHKMSEEERIQLDNYYADLFLNKKYSLWLDLKIIFRTIPVIFRKESA